MQLLQVGSCADRNAKVTENTAFRQEEAWPVKGQKWSPKSTFHFVPVLVIRSSLDKIRDNTLVWGSISPSSPLCSSLTSIWVRDGCPSPYAPGFWASSIPQTWVPKTAEPIQINCSAQQWGRGRDHVEFSASKAQNITWLFFSKARGLPGKGNQAWAWERGRVTLVLGQSQGLHRDMARALGCGKDTLQGIQPSKAVEFPILSVNPKWFVHFLLSSLHWPEWL